MPAENTQDNHSHSERTDLRTTDQHCSWRDVYARLDVDPSIDGTPDSSSPVTADVGDGSEQDDAASDDSTVIV